MMFKLVQKQTYTFLSHRYGIILIFTGFVLIILAAFHFGESSLEWSRDQYSQLFNIYHDNIAGKAFQNRMCLPIPIDAVYTWVNGTDPKLIADLQKAKLKLILDSQKKPEDDKKDTVQCKDDNCIPGRMIVLNGALPGGVHTVELGRNHIGFIQGDRIFNLSKSSRENVTVVQFEKQSVVNTIMKEKPYVIIKGRNITLSKGFLTSNWHAEGSFEVKDLAFVSNIGKNMTEEELKRKIPEDQRDNVKKIDLTTSAGVAIITLKTADVTKKFITEFEKSQLESGMKVSATYLLWGLEEDKSSIEEDVSRSRFEDNEEMRYSLRSLEQNAPWIRHVYIVTNGQIPSWLNLDNPRLTLVTHEDIFTDKSHLPTFSSPAIESNLHRIPGLSDKFIYLNDDTMFGVPIWPDDFYTHSQGQKIYLTWPVPNCADGCPPSWIRDNYCDTACNNSDCDWDGGDCDGVNKPGPVAGWGVQGHIDLSNLYCSSGCANGWIADRYCDQTCNVLDCGFDAGDCGVDNFNQLYSVDIKRPANITIPQGITAFYLNLTSIFGVNASITDAHYTEDKIIRTATVAQKFKLITMTLHVNITNTLIEVSVLGKTNQETPVNVTFNVTVNTMPVTERGLTVLKQEKGQKVKGDIEVIPTVFFPDIPENERKPKVVEKPRSLLELPLIDPQHLSEDTAAKLAELDKKLSEGDITEKGHRRFKAQLLQDYLQSPEYENKRNKKFTHEPGDVKNKNSDLPKLPQDVKYKTEDGKLDGGLGEENIDQIRRMKFSNTAPRNRGRLDGVGFGQTRGLGANGGMPEEQTGLDGRLLKGQQQQQHQHQQQQQQQRRQQQQQQPKDDLQIQPLPDKQRKEQQQQNDQEIKPRLDMQQQQQQQHQQQQHHQLKHQPEQPNDQQFQSRPNIQQQKQQNQQHLVQPQEGHPQDLNQDLLVNPKLQQQQQVNQPQQSVEQQAQQKQLNLQHQQAAQEQFEQQQFVPHQRNQLRPEAQHQKDQQYQKDQQHPLNQENPLQSQQIDQQQKLQLNQLNQQQQQQQQQQQKPSSFQHQETVQQNPLQNQQIDQQQNPQQLLNQQQQQQDQQLHESNQKLPLRQPQRQQQIGLQRLQKEQPADVQIPVVKEKNLEGLADNAKNEGLQGKPPDDFRANERNFEERDRETFKNPKRPPNIHDLKPILFNQQIPQQGLDQQDNFDQAGGQNWNQPLLFNRQPVAKTKDRKWREPQEDWPFGGRDGNALQQGKLQEQVKVPDQQNANKQTGLNRPVPDPPGAPRHNDDSNKQRLDKTGQNQFKPDTVNDQQQKVIVQDEPVLDQPVRQDPVEAGPNQLNADSKQIVGFDTQIKRSYPGRKKKTIKTFEHENDDANPLRRKLLDYPFPEKQLAKNSSVEQLPFVKKTVSTISQNDPRKVVRKMRINADGEETIYRKADKRTDLKMKKVEDPVAMVMDDVTDEEAEQLAKNAEKYMRKTSFLPWERTEESKEKNSEVKGDYETGNYRSRRTLDTFADSLIHVNRLYNKRFGFISRKVPGHIPHMIDVNIMKELHAEFPDEFEETSSHKIRHSRDMQFAFSYMYYVIGSPKEVNTDEIFDEFDTDHSGVLSDREIRTLATRLFDLPLDLQTLSSLENNFITCAKNLSQNVYEDPSLNAEKYYEVKMPQVTKALVAKCPAVTDLMKKSVKGQTNYKHEILGDEDIAFKMIRTNVSQVIGQLDDVRKNPKKFVCLNDNIDHSSPEAYMVKAVLQDFYEALFPIVSQFELPREYRNRFLHVDELREWKRYRDWLRFWTQLSLLALIVFSIASFCSHQLIALKRRCCPRQRTKMSDIAEIVQHV